MSRSVVLLFIFALALLIRITVAFSSKATWYNTDSYLYFDMAEAIMNGKPLSLSPNGYPLIIVIVKSVFGTRLLPAALVSLNVLFSVLTVLGCYAIGKVVASHWAGLLAATLMALWPNQINYMRQILTETPATFFLVLGFLLVVKQPYALGGAFIYAAALIRSTLLPVAILVLVWMILCRKKKAGIAFYVTGLAVVFLMNFALVKLQVIRPPMNADDNLLIAVQPEGADGVDFHTDSFTPEQKAHPLKTYLSALATSPGAFVMQRANSLWELWGPWPEAGNKNALRSFIGRCVIGLRFPLIILALVGLCQRRDSAYHWLMVIPILTITLVHVAFFSTPRFSYCAEPFAIVLCALLIFHAYCQGADKSCEYVQQSNAA